MFVPSPEPWTLSTATGRWSGSAGPLGYRQGMSATTSDHDSSEKPNRMLSLSPSRASDFMSCPLLYRFRNVDRLPEPPGPEAYRGTVVHAVLERLFDLPAPDRTLARAHEMIEPQWAELLAQEPELADLLFGPADNWLRQQSGTPLGEADQELLAAFLQEAGARLRNYFDLEDPRLLEPAERELYVEAVVADGLTLRGYIDRLDQAPDGRTRVVDYKTGRAPGEAFEQQAMFQLKCYALALWRSTDRMPTVLQLIYLADKQVLRYEPDEADLLATERKLGALWTAIKAAYESGDWRPRKSRLCDYCAHQSRCPEWGGTAPPLPNRQSLIECG